MAFKIRSQTARPSMSPPDLWTLRGADGRTTGGVHGGDQGETGGRQRRLLKSRRLGRFDFGD